MSQNGSMTGQVSTLATARPQGFQEDNIEDKKYKATYFDSREKLLKGYATTRRVMLCS